MSVWIFLAVHVLLFVLVGILHPIAILHIGMLALWSGVFLTCSGVYFSTRYRSVTTALLMNLGLAGVLWVLLPLGARQVGVILDARDMGDYVERANPLVQGWALASGATYQESPGGWRSGYSWLGTSFLWPTTYMMLASTAGYVLAGLLLAWRAKKMFRRNVFEG
jgi:hypothetical protein